MSAVDFDRAHLWRFRAMPLRAIDGDTCVVLVDTGFRGRHEAHVRIAGFDAPERGQDGHEGAAARLADAIFGNAYSPHEAGWRLRIVSRQRETVVSEVRSFERYVGDLYAVMADGSLVDVKELLV